MQFYNTKHETVRATKEERGASTTHQG